MRHSDDNAGLTSDDSSLKILILKPSSLGDVVQALPVLRLMKLDDPSRQIYWWLSSDLLPLLETDPDLDGIVPFDRQCWAHPRCWRRHFASVRRMRAESFDWVIDLQGLARSGLFAWLARGELTIGLDDHREGARGFYDIVVPRPSFLTHAVDWYLEVLRRLKVPVHGRFSWLPPRGEVVKRVRQKWPVGDSRWVIVNPGARWLTKRWPVEYYETLIHLITTAYPDVQVAVVGSGSEVALGAAIAETHPQRCLDLTGRTSLPELIEWIRFSDLMVCNDTGPMHIAAALRKPVVAIFGPTEPRRTGPYLQVDQAIQYEVPCAPCFRSRCASKKTLECLVGIRPPEVFEQVRGWLDRTALPAVRRLPDAESGVSNRRAE